MSIPAFTPKLLLDTLKVADNGRVECSVITPDGVRKGVIEASFFEEFLSAGTQNGATALSPARQVRIVQDNVTYLEQRTAELWARGERALVIR
jgi:hypothetical protein